MGMPARKKLKAYEPSKKAKRTAAALKQELTDLQQRLSMDVGALLVLYSEGSLQQAEMAKQKTKATLLKHGPDMSKLAEELGGELPEATQGYLDSVDAIVHAPKGAGGWLDESTITRCYKMTEKLQKAL